MAHHVEPMDIDSDFDNKENSLHHNNVLPFTEKGYEELDVSELNMKLRYSVTPASSPMSKSFTANCLDNRSLESGDDSLNVTVNENFNLSHSLNSTLTKNDNVIKSLKALPLQAIPTEQFVDSNRNTSVLRPIDSPVTPDNGNITVTVSGPGDIDENLSLPSSSSSALYTPEATTPTKDMPLKDGGSPIMRGLKSVLNMFRSSQSPIPPSDHDAIVKQEMLSPLEQSSQENKSQNVLASTPIASHRKKEMSPTKRSSPQKDSSIVFNDDLEKELQWKDETTIIFSQERIPIHKLMLQQPQDKNSYKETLEIAKQGTQELNTTVEYMDISYNDSFRDRTITEIQVDNVKTDCTFAESDSEFVDCETTFTKNKSPTLEDIDKKPSSHQAEDLDITKDIENKNDSGSRLKQIILDTTQDILDATLSVRPEDLLPEILEQTKDVSQLLKDKTENIDTSELTKLTDKVSTQNSQPILDQTVDVTSPLVLQEKSTETGLNSTKTIEAATTTQLNNETFDVAASMTNKNNLGENLDATRTLANILGVTQILHDNLYQTKTIELTSNKETVNQTFDMANASNETILKENTDITRTVENNLGVTQILETNVSENLNITKTIAMTSTQTGNQTFDIASTTITDNTQKDNLDNTRTVENTAEMNQTFETYTTENLNSTKTIDVASTTQTIDQTFDVGSAFTTEAHQKENLDVTKTLENNLNVTQVLEIQTSILKNMSTQLSNTTVIEDNKNIDTIVAVVTDNAKEKEIAPEIKDSVCQELSAVATVDPDALKEAITPLPIPDEFNISDVQDVTMTELPVDIPLPDEDDLDKEMNMTIDFIPVNVPVNLPLDLVDDIKSISETNETMNVAIDTTDIKIENVNTEVVLHEVCSSINNSKIEGDNVNKEAVQDNFTEMVPDKSAGDDQINIKNEMSEICKEIENTNLLPENVPTTDVGSQEVEGVADKAIENSKMNEINVETTMIETIKDEKSEEQVKEETIHIQNDSNESDTALKPLPDIINQTIAISSNENTIVTPDVPASVVQEEVISSSENKDLPEESKKPEVITRSINEIAHEVKPNITVDTNAIVSSSEDAIVAQANVCIQKTASETADVETMVQVTDIIDTKEVDVTATETHNLLVSDVPSNVEVATEQSISKETEEEIVLSENNSPFVSVIAENIPETKPESTAQLENVDDPFATRTKVVLTPPSSPPIRSKGYNFNFDHMDFDPFATKTNIRMSPTLDSPNKNTEPNVQEDKIFERPAPKKDTNRRKSQPERKKPAAASKRKFNSTFDGKISDKVIEKPVQKPETRTVPDIQLESPPSIALSPEKVKIEEKLEQNTVTPIETVCATEPETKLQEKVDKAIEVSTDASDNSIEANLNEVKPTSSSSDQSTYFSACTTSSESSVASRNVFNLPEIDDVNFNPFATKSKMRQSPPPEIDNPFTTKSKIMSSPDSSMVVIQKSDAKTNLSEDKIETELMEKDASINLSNTSKVTDDKNVTTKEINTEDEDTVEGPFLDPEDVNPDEKMSDFDGENVDMLQFNELPPQNNEEQLDNGEMFIDAEAFEFLLNQNKSNTVADSGKESLFLKFDPLFAKRMSAVSSEGVLASLAKLQKRQSTPTKVAKTSPKNMPSSVAGPSNFNTTQDIEMNTSEEFNDDLNITVSKPMMVVPPAVNPVTPRNKSLTPNRSNRRSITFTSPAMAVIDRLLSLSNNSSLMHDTTVTQVSREQNEADIALSQLRELLAEKEINVYNLKCESNELRDRLNALEGQVKSLEAESEDRLKKINQLNDTLVEKTKINKSMAAVVEEYERTIASLIAETAQDKKKHAEERMKLINERDEQTAHLASMEVSFSDLHSKYEKSKQVILNCKANEDVFRKSIKEFEENLAKMHNNYELLKQHATSKLNHANQELEKINRSHEAEVLKLNAMIKRKELHITSLEESLTQKTKANDELTAICDELINKVG